MANRKVGTPDRKGMAVKAVDSQSVRRSKLTKLEKLARREAAQSIRVASYGGDFSNTGGGSIRDADANFYSPQLSTDFLELPQSEREKRELFRFWYSSNEIVGSAIDFHTTVPISKIRLSLPKGKDMKTNNQILHFYEQMCKRVRLFQTLYDMTHEYFLHGNCYVYSEDHDMTDEIPEFLLVDEKEEEVGDIDYAGRTSVKKTKNKTPKPESEQTKNIKEFVAKNYRGWERLQILPPEQVKLETFQYTNRTIMELIPSEKDRLVVMKALEQHDPDAMKIADDIPKEIQENLLTGQPIPLNTSPYDDFLCSSFCYHLAYKKSPYDDRGISLLERCHLPETEVTARRAGFICQIPIEDLNPEIDEVLGGSGLWRKFECGTRPFSGKTVTTDVAKLNKPITSTWDHKMEVLRDGELTDVIAEEVKPGDYIQIATINNRSTITKIDLYDFFLKEKWTYEHRNSKEERVVSIIPEKIGNKLILHHEWIDENPQRSLRAKLLGKVVEWINDLNEEVCIMSKDFRQIFGGMGDSMYRAMLKNLVAVGYIAPVSIVDNSRLKSVGHTFKPAKIDVSKLYKKHFEQECPKELELTKDLGYLIGYFLGDGWINGRNSPSQYGTLGICYDKNTENSVKSAQKITNIIDSLGLDRSNKFYKLNHICNKSDWFNRWVGNNFGHNKSDKHIPEWVFSSPEEFKLGLFSGLFDSDGWVNESKRQLGYVCATIGMTTKNLIDQLTLLACSIGMSPSRRFKGARKVKQANGHISDAKPQYWLVFGCFSDLYRLQDGGSVKLLKVNFVNRSKSGWQHLQKDDKLFYKVKSVKSNNYTGPVYSLNVEEDHSFFANLARTDNCLRTLLFRDKIRQTQTSIASRAMTPKRVIWAEKMSEIDVDSLRDQVEQALIDPDFSIVTNFEVHWDEIGARDRLLDLSTEYEVTTKLLCIGLRVTESMLTGESTYAGERIHLDVMNTMYLLYRETIAEYVENYLFAPVAEKKGFFEIDDYGNKVLLYPKLQFTRLALRDNDSLQDFLFNLYQKGSLPIRFILDLVNIDADETLEQLKKDMFTPNDSTFNEFLLNVLRKAGEELVDETDIKEKLAKGAGLQFTKKGNRFGNEEGSTG